MTIRPTLSEQLAGIQRALNSVVAPEVRAEYPAEILRRSADIIGALAGREQEDRRRLAAEISGMVGLFETIRNRKGLAAGDDPRLYCIADTAIDESASYHKAELRDTAEIEAIGIALRGYLAAIIREFGCQQHYEWLTVLLFGHVNEHVSAF